MQILESQLAPTRMGPSLPKTCYVRCIGRKRANVLAVLVLGATGRSADP